MCLKTQIIRYTRTRCFPMTICWEIFAKKKKCRFPLSLFFLDDSIYRNFRVLVHYVNRKDSIMISNLILSLFYESLLFRSQCSTFWMFLVCENIKNVLLGLFKNDLNTCWIIVTTRGHFKNHWTCFGATVKYICHLFSLV